MQLILVLIWIKSAQGLNLLKRRSVDAMNEDYSLMNNFINMQTDKSKDKMDPIVLPLQALQDPKPIERKNLKKLISKGRVAAKKAVVGTSYDYIKNFETKSVADSSQDFHEDAAKFPPVSAMDGYETEAEDGAYEVADGDTILSRMVSRAGDLRIPGKLRESSSFSDNSFYSDSDSDTSEHDSDSDSSEQDSDSDSSEQDSDSDSSEQDSDSDTSEQDSDSDALEQDSDIDTSEHNSEADHSDNESDASANDQELAEIDSALERVMDNAFGSMDAVTIDRSSTVELSNDYTETSEHHDHDNYNNEYDYHQYDHYNADYHDYKSSHSFSKSDYTEDNTNEESEYQYSYEWDDSEKQYTGSDYSYSWADNHDH